MPVPSDAYPLIVYDGDCLVCSALMQLVVRRDEGRYKLISGSDARLADESQLTDTANTIYLLASSDESLAKSDALVAILKNLGGIYPALGSVLGLLPRGLRDRVYDVFARNRYRWNSQKICPTPSDEMRDRLV